MKTHNEPHQEQLPNSECYLIHQRSRQLTATLKPKPFFLPQSLKKENSNATEPQTTLARRNMNLVRAIGRGIASPTAVPRRPPSPGERTPGGQVGRSRSPPNKVHRRDTTPHAHAG
eukprot:1183051-Prorocentrum_minimum.AAC.2